MTATNQLTISGVTKAFGEAVVARDITLEVTPGQRHGLIGVNGAGKTTLFNIVMGEIAPDQGEVQLGGQSLTGLSVRQRTLRGLGRTYQVSSLVYELTVRGNLALAVGDGGVPSPWRSWRRVADQADIVATARRLALDHLLDQPVRELSHGEMRQLELAMALHRHPHVLLLDEPAAGLSRREREVLVQVIRDLPKDISLLMIEHDMEVMLELSEWISVMHLGQVHTAGEPAAIARDPGVRAIYLGDAYA